MNHVILIGRLTDDPSITVLDESQKLVLTIAVPRTFKNSEGIYETDFIRCILWNGIAKRTKEYCKKGDVVCVRGRLQQRSYETEESGKKFITEVIVESIAFVSSYKERPPDMHESINEEENDKD